MRKNKRIKATPFPHLSREPLTGGEMKYAEQQLKIFEKTTKAYAKEFNTPEKALAELVRQKILTPTGRLTKKYRNPK